MKLITKLILVSIVFVCITFGQTQHTIMTYNILNYPDTDTTIHNPYFRTIFSSIQPDILVCQEMMSQSGVNGFLNKVLNQASSGYTAGLFLDGPDTDSEIFYKSAYFTFISNTPIPTDLRNINEFKLVENSSGDTIRIYSVHLKASTGSSNEQQRLAEVNVLRSVTNSLPSGSFYMVVGDFNIYASSEPAYLALLNQSNPGYFIDLFNLPGVWNDPDYAFYHTQSTRVSDLGDGGSTGGLDDRFDMILMSQSIINSGDITYVPGSYNVYGNDGDHFNISINQPPNGVVSQQVADALHYATDHLPVYATFSFDAPPYLEISSFTVLIEGFFDGNTMNPDTVTIELRNSLAPYSLVDQAKVFLNNNGQGTPKFYNAENGVPYYLVVKHRNAIETWSAFTQTFSAGTLSYDFTTGSDKAFGNNLKQIGTKWCIYGGDVNQDGFVDGTDLNLVFSDNVNGVTGYVSTDLNGDLFTESADLNLVFSNNVLGVEGIRP